MFCPSRRNAVCLHCCVLVALTLVLNARLLRTCWDAAGTNSYSQYTGQSGDGSCFPAGARVRVRQADADGAMAVVIKRIADLAIGDQAQVRRKDESACDPLICENTMPLDEPISYVAASVHTCVKSVIGWLWHQAG